VRRLSVIDVDRCVGCQSCMFACARRLGHGGLAGSCIGVHSAAGMRRGFVVIVCRACTNPPCARVCPTDALVGAVFWDPERNKPQICVYCGYCAPYCPYEVLALEEIEEKAHVEG